ncbi:Eukaryotic translation initiation factor 2 subunit alpha [Nosema bombycis CQ1]|uniref:Eukaryotic translation initiation factor 2 subunit alpha n=3 Tax=Nosema bombycis TaxID=27978 RepID=R0KQE1_NOSB1|nr:40S ribosomal protein S1 and IF2 [Nosema bombycis]EOB12936.1 Eukaryotic translation initiation factor 2 subunit alpha [Nosema bombycis CQ1]|eukprot:EOB12936.1 Eukaryotic translation initiation factor 2 subunit alpha [Nosema bombycis CQ1]
MASFECSFYDKKYPAEGEIVIGKVVTIDSDGVSIDLLEYGKAHGLVLLGELSKKRIKSANQCTKVNNIEICNVLRVDNEKGYIDLSITKVNESEKEECRKTYIKNKTAYYIMAKAAKKLKMNVKDLYETFGYKKAEEYGSLYYFFARVKEDESILEDDNIGMTIKKLIKEQFQASSYKVRADIDLTCQSSGGILTIKEAFKKVLQKDSKLQISLNKTPTYSITRVSSDKEKAYNSVNDACKEIEDFITKFNGTFCVVSKAKLYGEKSKFSLLSTADDEFSGESSEQ